MSDPLDGQLLGEWAIAERINEVRREGDRRLRGAVLSLADLAEAVERFCIDPTARSLPEGWQDGLRVLQAKARQCLADQGVAPIATVGEKLDPRLHLVVEVAQGPGEAGAIVREARPGYSWQGQVLRPAEVVTVGGQSSAG